MLGMSIFFIRACLPAPPQTITVPSRLPPNPPAALTQLGLGEMSARKLRTGVQNLSKSLKTTLFCLTRSEIPQNEGYFPTVKPPLPLTFMKIDFQMGQAVGRPESPPSHQDQSQGKKSYVDPNNNFLSLFSTNPTPTKASYFILC